MDSMKRSFMPAIKSKEELDAIQRARALKALDSIHKVSVIKGTNRITADEIQSEIAAVRKE